MQQCYMWQFPIRKWTALICCSLLCSACQGRWWYNASYGPLAVFSFRAKGCEHLGSCYKKGFTAGWVLSMYWVTQPAFWCCVEAQSAHAQPQFRVSECSGARATSGFFPTVCGNSGVWSLRRPCPTPCRSGRPGLGGSFPAQPFLAALTGRTAVRKKGVPATGLTCLHLPDTARQNNAKKALEVTRREYACAADSQGGVMACKESHLSYSRSPSTVPMYLGEFRGILERYTKGACRKKCGQD